MRDRLYFVVGLAITGLTSSCANLPKNKSLIASPATASADRQTIVEDGPVKIGYRFDGPMIEFSSELQSGWTFQIVVDGDQNRVWGFGPGKNAIPNASVSPDFAIGQGSVNGVICGQYVFSASALDPNRVAQSSTCDRFPTDGFVKISQMSSNKYAEITYVIPQDKMFGKNRSIWLDVCVWDTRRSKCYFPLDRLYVINRPT